MEILLELSHQTFKKITEIYQEKAPVEVKSISKNEKYLLYNKTNTIT